MLTAYVNTISGTIDLTRTNKFDIRAQATIFSLTAPFFDKDVSPLYQTNPVFLYPIKVTNIFLLDMVDDNIDCIECFPVSSNKIFLLGTLDYCRYALKLNKNNNEYLNNSIKDYISSANNIYRRIPAQLLKKLNLQTLKDNFSLIEDYCASNNILPTSEDITADFLNKNNLL